MKKVFLVVALVLAACGGSDSSDVSADGPTTTAGAAAVFDSTTSAPATEETQPPTTEGSSPSTNGITLTIGDETWEFGSAQCAFVGANPGEEGSEWNVSNIKDGAQVYVSDDSFGQLVQFADISNGGNPGFNWEAGEEGLSMSVSGNDISITGEFTDTVGGTGPLAGTLSATCPSWAQG